MILRIITFIFAFFIILPRAHAGDEGLYDPLPPKNAAFVRFLNSSDAAITPTINAEKYAPVQSHNFSPYYAIKPTSIATGKNLRAGQYYTIHQEKIYTDPAISDLEKSFILFYNLTSEKTLSLKTQNGKITIIENIKPKQTGNRMINPVTLGFSVYDNNKKIADVTTTALNRGQAYSLVVVEKQNNFRTIWVQATTRLK